MCSTTSSLRTGARNGTTTRPATGLTPGATATVPTAREPPVSEQPTPRRDRLAERAVDREVDRLTDPRADRLDQPLAARRSLVRRPQMDPDTFGRFAEGFARFMGTARFLGYMTVFVLIWVAWNFLAPENLRFDPYAFIFLTLMLSLQASYAAPLILLAQNRQADRDKVVIEQDR